MRGVTNIEFLVAAFVFLTVIAFISFSILTNVPLLRGRAGSEDIKSLAYRLSEQIVFDKGLDAAGTSTQWTAENFSRIGLAGNRHYEISESKINELKTLCSTRAGYGRFKDFVGSSADAEVISNFGTEEKICLFNITSLSRNQFTITRPVVMNGIEGKISIKIIG